MKAGSWVRRPSRAAMPPPNPARGWLSRCTCCNPATLGHPATGAPATSLVEPSDWGAGLAGKRSADAPAEVGGNHRRQACQRWAARTICAPVCTEHATRRRHAVIKSLTLRDLVVVGGGDITKIGASSRHWCQLRVPILSTKWGKQIRIQLVLRPAACIKLSLALSDISMGRNNFKIQLEHQRMSRGALRVGSTPPAVPPHRILSSPDV